MESGKGVKRRLDDGWEWPIWRQKWSDRLLYHALRVQALEDTRGSGVGIG